MMDTGMMAPQATRIRHDTVRRSLTVIWARLISPNMLRLRLGGRELAGFVSSSPGDHIKLFVPDGAGGTVMRDYTPRRFDVRAGWLDIDFALHEAGPATQWAMAAKPGDTAVIGGPRGSLVIGGPIAHWVLVGDETALPSIARRIEEMAPATKVTSLVAVPGAADQQVLDTAAQHRAIWVHRSDPTDASGLLRAFAALDLPAQSFVWIAAEAGVARQLRDAALARGITPDWLRAAGYWVAGEADSSAKDL